MDNNLGSYPNELILSKLQPSYWFSAHLHVHYAAIVDHDMWKKGIYPPETQSILYGNRPQPIAVNNPDEIKVNPDEIDISLSDDEIKDNPDEIEISLSDDNNNNEAPVTEPPVVEEQAVNDPPKFTKFLSLDKCLPRRQFLQVI